MAVLQKPTSADAPAARRVTEKTTETPATVEEVSAEPLQEAEVKAQEEAPAGAAAPVRAAAAAPPSAAAAARTEVPEALIAAARKLSDIEGLRQQAKATLLQASLNGKLAELLGKSASSGKSPSAAAAEAGAKAQATARATAVLGSGSSRARASRRKQQPVGSPPAPKEDDTRDLDELLREIGEIPTTKAKNSVAKAGKRKAAKAGAKLRSAKTDVKAPETTNCKKEEPELDEDAQEGAGEARVGEEEEMAAELADAEISSDEAPAQHIDLTEDSGNGSCHDGTAPLTIADCDEEELQLGPLLAASAVAPLLEKALAVSAAAESLSPTRLQGAMWQQPSVGTWMSGPATVPMQSPTAQGHMQLWPATPESTPPGSPRGCNSSSSEGVVWVPVPLHCLAEVQDVIRKKSGDCCTELL
mmetsp:Transcript_106333/g.184835  ORF Transcript_106333/g.184835 Transcript_106333/m.184835 type:complete len:416 (-) Transcript_106333:98-1345(-)